MTRARALVSTTARHAEELHQGRAGRAGRTAAVDIDDDAGARRPAFELIQPSVHREPAERAGRRRAGAGIRARYPVVAGVSARILEKIVAAAVDRYGERVPEALDAGLRARLGFPGDRRGAARDARAAGLLVRGSRRPSELERGRARGAPPAGVRGSAGGAAGARRRAPAGARGRGARVRGGLGAILRAVRAALPFELTAAQAQAIDEIARDLAAPHPMQRLLVGDVGSGKTAVAFAAAAIAAAAGGQTLLMAPTEVLVEQHLRTLGRRSLARAPGRPAARGALHRVDAARRARRDAGALPRGRDPAAGRHAGAARVAAGLRRSAPGDRRRAAPLRRRPARAPAPHGRRARRRPAAAPAGDVGHADPAHAGAHALRRSRRDVPARAAAGPPAGRDRDLLRRRADAPRRRRGSRPRCATGVRRTWSARCARAPSARARSPRWRARPSSAARCGRRASASGCCTARSTPTTKESRLRAFAAGDIDVLVATTVIELGIDVPNATVMLVEEADRFGLAQLHQLRGRVGRGAAGGACLLCTVGGAAARQRGGATARRSWWRRTTDFASPRRISRSAGTAISSARARPARRAGGSRDSGDYVDLLELARAERDRIEADDPGLAQRRARRPARGGARALGGGSGLRRGDRVEAQRWIRKHPVRNAAPTDRGTAPAGDTRASRWIWPLAGVVGGALAGIGDALTAVIRGVGGLGAQKAVWLVLLGASLLGAVGLLRRRRHPGRAADRRARAQPRSPPPGDADRRGAGDAAALDLRRHGDVPRPSRGADARPSLHLAAVRGGRRDADLPRRGALRRSAGAAARRDAVAAPAHPRRPRSAWRRWRSRCRSRTARCCRGSTSGSTPRSRSGPSRWRCWRLGSCWACAPAVRARGRSRRAWRC